jgi:chromosome segregation ATPase
VRIIADATDESERAVERLERRRAEAETGAASLRALVAEEVTRARADAAEERRRAKEEAVAHVAEARAEADRLRENARLALERARAEIAQLQAKRDRIVAELGQWSGVIEALSVPETEQPRAAQVAPEPHPFAPEFQPDQETPDA